MRDLFELVHLWCRATVPGYARPVTRDQLGYRGAGPWADEFIAPEFDASSDIAQGGTGHPRQGPSR